MTDLASTLKVDLERYREMETFPMSFALYTFRLRNGHTFLVGRIPGENASKYAGQEVKAGQDPEWVEGQQLVMQAEERGNGFFVAGGSNGWSWVRVRTETGVPVDPWYISMADTPEFAQWKQCERVFVEKGADLPTEVRRAAVLVYWCLFQGQVGAALPGLPAEVCFMVLAQCRASSLYEVFWYGERARRAAIAVAN
jgi:hypothetical protein